MKSIIIFGETGVGKSSLINMAIGPDGLKAEVSDSAAGCTFQSKVYQDESGNRLFDTVGLNESGKGTVTAKDALFQLIKLLKSLESGVNLVVFVIKRGRITETMVKNYAIIVKGICQNKVPAVLVITGCEYEMESGQWWQENKNEFEKNQMTFDAVLSGCFTDNREKINPRFHEAILESFNETKIKLVDLLKSEKYDKVNTFGGWKNWVRTAIGKIWNVIAKVNGWPQMSLWDSLKFALMELLGIGETEATAMANEVAVGSLYE